MSHTLGPWRGRLNAMFGNFSIVSDTQERVVAVNVKPVDVHLIAAVPDMLAALKLVRDNCNYDEGFLDAVEAAIAKAESQP